MLKVIVVPLSGSESQVIEPPWSIMIDIAIESPSPVPLPDSFVVKKGSKTRLASSSAPPLPL